VRQKQAALAQASVDLNNTYIRAPVDGVVVSRSVDVGQTVAASLQAPTLFLIAQDLTKMQVDTNVDEADIGRVALEQEATFTVDSYPGQTFRGRVMQIRQAPQVVQNVVTYNTVVAVSNLDHKLKPGMTANVKLLVARRENALLVPNAVFRFRLDAGNSGSVAQRPGGPAGGGGVQARGSGGPAGGGEGRAAGGPSRAGAQGMGPGASRGPESMGQPTEGARQRIYVLADGKPTERQVKTGLSDGQRTEILDGLNEGDAVIVGTGQQRSGPNTQGGPRLRL
jgi:HlyD family secretion protein